MTTALFRTEGTFTHKNLHRSDYPRVQRKVTLLPTVAVLPVGAVLGKVTANGKYNLSLSAASDGSQTVNAILIQEAPINVADQEVLIEISGDYIATELTFGAGHTAASTRDAARALGLYY